MADQDWRAERIEQVRRLIKAVGPTVTEEAKWKKPTNPSGVPTWSAGAIICTAETYKDKVKLTFMTGAKLADPAGLFNAGLDGSARRAIDINADYQLDEAAFTALVKEAVG